MRWLLLFVTFVYIASPYKVAMYLQLIGKSHLDFASALISALTDKGHTVDLLLALFNTEVQWQNVTKARNATSFGFPTDSPWMETEHLNDPFNTVESIDMRFFFDVGVDLCRIGLESGEPIEYLKNGNYDAILVSEYDYCGFIMARTAGIKTVISYTSTNLLYFQLLNLGLPSPVSAVLSNFDAFGGDFSVWAKMQRLFWTGKQVLVDRRTTVDNSNALARKHFGPDFPDVQQLTRDIDVVFVNSNEIIEMPRTISHKVRYIGGVGLRKPKQISKTYEEMLSSSTKGNVMISFGTQVPSKNFASRVKTAIADAARAFKEYTFIWKYTKQQGDERIFGNDTENLKFVEWLPQTELLYSGRISAFITHAGLNSVLEFAHSGVPVILIPLFADQEFNARNAVRLGLGVQLNKLRFASSELTSALNYVLGNPRYTEQSKHVAKMLEKSPVKVKDEFLKWTEFAIEHGDLHKVNVVQRGRIITTFLNCENENVVFAYFALQVIQSYTLFATMITYAVLAIRFIRIVPTVRVMLLTNTIFIPVILIAIFRLINDYNRWHQYSPEFRQDMKEIAAEMMGFPSNSNYVVFMVDTTSHHCHFMLDFIYVNIMIVCYFGSTVAFFLLGKYLKHETVSAARIAFSKELRTSMRTSITFIVAGIGLPRIATDVAFFFFPRVTTLNTLPAFLGSTLVTLAVAVIFLSGFYWKQTRSVWDGFGKACFQAQTVRSPRSTEEFSRYG